MAKCVPLGCIIIVRKEEGWYSNIVHRLQAIEEGESQEQVSISMD